MHYTPDCQFLIVHVPQDYNEINIHLAQKESPHVFYLGIVSKYNIFENF